MSDDQQLPPTVIDLNQWVSEVAPALLDAEEAEGWGHGTSDPPRPVTAAVAEGSPLRLFLADDGVDAPAELSRTDKAAWYAERETLRERAVEAVADAQRAHDRWERLRATRAAADVLDARLARVAARDAEQQRAPAEDRQPAPYGRW